METNDLRRQCGIVFPDDRYGQFGNQSMTGYGAMLNTTNRTPDSRRRVTFLIAGALLLGVATVLSILLVFMLSLRLRRRELETMAKIGCSRFRIALIVAWEVVLVIGVSVGIAASLTLMTRHFGGDAIRWFLL